jgi:hypothetical protein
MANKLSFAGKGKAIADALGKLANDLSDFNDVYFDRGYNGGGADPIVDGDITDLGITASDIAGLSTIASQFDNFLNNAAVTAADYDTTISKLRSDL